MDFADASVNRRRMEERKWSEVDVLNILTKPVYAGFGPFPQVVPDAAFIEAGTRLINERGAAWYIETLLDDLREAMPSASSDASPPEAPAGSTKRRPASTA